MSITQFENPEGELISQVDINPQKLSAETSRCSCIDCNFIGCLKKGTDTTDDLANRSTLPNNNSREFKVNQASSTKKIIKEVVKKKTIESLKRVTETMYEFDTNEHFGINTDRSSKHSNNMSKPMPMRSMIGNKVVCCKKSSCKNSDKSKCCKKNTISQSNIGIKKDKPIVQVPSTDINQPHKEDNTASKLSAQVMNVPYEDIHEMVPSTQEITEQNPLGKLNVFKRIKEIYDACSCKVCECISNAPPESRDDFCNCKPCQCEDCVKSRNNIEEKIRRIPHPGCPCIRCDRRDCHGIVKNTCSHQVCDCNPNDSIQYTNKLTKRCKCEPCECINCRSGFRTPKTVKLGQVDEIIQRDVCHCSPCDCIECNKTYNRTNATIMYTHSTDMNKYHYHYPYSNCGANRYQLDEIDTCRHEELNKDNRKSFNNNYNDCDIHRAIVNSNGLFNQQKEGNLVQHDTVALFASLKNSYPNYLCNKVVCKCNNCECIECGTRHDSLNNRDRLGHNVISELNYDGLPTLTRNACKCMPCECEICSKKAERKNSLAAETTCKCNVCDCLNCENASLVTASIPSSLITHYNINESQPEKRIKSMVVNKNCDCIPCDCSNCRKLFNCSSSIKYYSDEKCADRNTTGRLRKVMLVTPSTSECHYKAHKTYVKSISSSNLSSKQSPLNVFGQDLSSCHAISHNYAPINHLSNTNKHQVRQLYQNSNEYKGISDENFDRNLFYNANCPILDTVSFKSLEKPQIVDFPFELTQRTYKTHKTVNERQHVSSKVKLKSFNIIQDQPDNILTSNKSDELLPVSWTCCNETSHSSNISQNDKTSENIRSNLKDEFNEKAKDISENEMLKHNDKFKIDDTPAENNKHSYRVKKHICNDKCIDSRTKPHKCSDYIRNNVKSSILSYEESDVNQSHVTIDYETATRVLGEAKAFSLKLIKMLNGFETANRQFESASLKFKVLHENLLDINESGLKTYSTNLGRIPIPVFEDTFENISEVQNDYMESADDNIKNENEPEREYEPTTTPKEINLHRRKPLIPRNYVTLESNHIDKIIANTNSSITAQNEICTATQKLKSQPQLDKALNESDKQLITSESPHLHVSLSTNLKISRTDIDNKTINKTEYKNVANIVKKPTLAAVMKEFDSVFHNTTNSNTAVGTNDIENNIVELAKQAEIPWLIFKKNLYLDHCPKVKKTVFESSALEMDIKEAIEAISLQTNENYPKVITRPNEALANLQSEVNNLLNMPLLQTSSKCKFKIDPDVLLFPKNKLDYKVKSTCSTAASQTCDRTAKADKEVYFNINTETNQVNCEQLKANIVGLRKVSDHTVLVKWNVPKRIDDVNGYELLVNGRAVQKIFSPKRSMAVVTCLPQAARVLLTIRTVVSATVDCGHAPASSIMYRPKIK